MYNIFVTFKLDKQSTIFNYVNFAVNIKFVLLWKNLFTLKNIMKWCTAIVLTHLTPLAPGSNLAACVNKAINDRPEHTAGCYLLSVIQAVTKNWVSVKPALANGHRLKRTPVKPSVLARDISLSWLACTNKPLTPGGVELRTLLALGSYH